MMMPTRRTFLAGTLSTMAGSGMSASARAASLSQPHPAADADDRCVVLVTLDGLRWQDLFRGADASLMDRTGGDKAAAASIRQKFWRESPQERRALMMPFVWEAIASKGRLIGNPDEGSSAVLKNGLKFSYPGYNEMLTGAPDPRVNSNNKIPNPNVNVLEWLHGQEGFRGRVAAFCSWDVFPFILNRERAGLPVQAGWEPISGNTLSEREQTINALIEGCHREWDNNIYDAFTFESALETLRKGEARVVYIAVGETDEHAHHNRYDFYLRAARRADEQLRRIWNLVQAHPRYAGKTSLVITTDHGRGEGDAWTSHGKDIEGAEKIWVGLLGPGIAASGGPHQAEVSQSQVAATVAALVGKDFRAAFPQAAPSMVAIDT